MYPDLDQWISYDTPESLEVKRKFITDNCLGGVMIWAIDHDTNNFELLTGLFGQEFMDARQISGGLLSSTDKEKIAAKLSSLTGDGCYVTTQCAGPNISKSRRST